MNYPSFLKRVDQLANACNEEALRLFVHEIARTLSEERRDEFVQTLQGFCHVSQESFEEIDDDGESTDEMIEKLQEISDGERSLLCDYNEEWDDWRDSFKDEFRFSDPEGILDDIAKAVARLHECLDKEWHREGAWLAEALAPLAVTVYGEYPEASMNMKDLDTYGLLEFDYAKMAREAIYLACVGNEMDQRAEEMLDIVSNLQVSFSLEDILGMGSAEIDLDGFLPSWIEALAKRTSAQADALLGEALGMLEDDDAVLAYASRYASSHPVLYQNILRDGGKNGDVGKMMRIGLKAMEEVPRECKERNEICLLTAGFALGVQEQETAEKCWLEAFKTLPSAMNYLRLRLLSRCWDDYAGTVRGIYDEYYASMDSWRRRALAPLLFFDGRFDEMIDQFMNPGNGIGWSGTFMKQGIALMLMLLDRGNDQQIGMRKMIGTASGACDFVDKEYCKGTQLAAGDDKNLFAECFGDWKRNITLSEETCDEWLKKIDGWIELRVGAIMAANRRKNYDECAGFIAAYGEVLQSRGKDSGKYEVMWRYKNQYARRRAFHDSLKQFGMR